MKNKKISVVVRCKNEERWIGHTFQSIVDHVPNNEIILVDNNSSDLSIEIARQFQHNPFLPENQSKYTDIKIINIDKYSPGAALNLGVKYASGEYIMIISSHCQLTGFNVEKSIADLDKYDAIFGNQNPIYRGQKLAKRYIWSHFGDQELSLIHI